MYNGLTRDRKGAGLIVAQTSSTQNMQKGRTYAPFLICNGHTEYTTGGMENCDSVHVIWLIDTRNQTGHDVVSTILINIYIKLLHEVSSPVTCWTCQSHQLSKSSWCKAEALCCNRWTEYRYSFDPLYLSRGRGDLCWPLSCLLPRDFCLVCGSSNRCNSRQSIQGRWEGWQWLQV